MAITEKYVTHNAAGGDGSIGSPWTIVEGFAALPAGGGMRLNVKDTGTYTLGADLAVANAGAPGSPNIIRGYGTTIGDGYQGRTSDTGALVTTNMPTIDGGASYKLNLGSKNDLIMESIEIIGSVTSNLVSANLSRRDIFKSCIINNSNSAANAKALVLYVNNHAIDCDVTSNASSNGVAITILGSGCVVIGCRVKSTNDKAINISGTACLIAFNLIYESNYGIYAGAASPSNFIVGNTFVDCANDAIYAANVSHVDMLAVYLNMITDNGRAIYNANATARAMSSWRNRTRDNTSGDSGYGDSQEWEKVTTDTGGQATDYTDAGSDDYTLIAASPAVGEGAWDKADIGAYPNRGVAGGGGGGFVQAGSGRLGVREA